MLEQVVEGALSRFRSCLRFGALHAAEHVEPGREGGLIKSDKFY